MAEGPQAQIHYAPRENLESLDAREIGRAQLSIDMAAYVLSDREIIEALIDAAERGVVIRLYLDKSQFAEHGPTRGGLVEALLAHPNVAARVKGEGVLMHLKAYAIDGEALRTGSGNFSRSGLAAQDNDAIFITDQADVDAFETNFERIWARARTPFADGPDADAHVAATSFQCWRQDPAKAKANKSKQNHLDLL